MNGDGESLKNNQTYCHLETEMKSEGLQRGGLMDSTPVAVNSEAGEAKKKKRRYFTVEYKMRVLREADLCRGKVGAIGALVRREGLFSSTLTEWRKQRDSGTLSTLSQKRGRKLKHTPEIIEIEKLTKHCGRLEEENRQLRVVVQVQKKISEILGAKPVDTSHLAGLDD